MGVGWVWLSLLTFGSNTLSFLVYILSLTHLYGLHVCMVVIVNTLQVSFHFVCIPCCSLFVYVSTLFQEEQHTCRQAKANQEKLDHVILRQAVVLY